MSTARDEAERIISAAWGDNRWLAYPWVCEERDAIEAALTAAERRGLEKAAKVCDAEAKKRHERANNPLPGDEHLRPFPQQMVQDSMGINAGHLAKAIRALAEEEG